MMIFTRAQKSFLENNSVFFIFTLVVVAMLLGIRFPEAYYIMLFPLTMLLVFDIVFRVKRKGKWEKYGRDYKSTLDGIRAAIQYTTFLFGFIGIALSKCFDDITNNPLIAFINKSSWLKAYALTIILSVLILLLFIPVVYRKPSTKKEPSEMLKNYYLVVLYLQKVVIILTVYLLLNFIVNQF